MPAYPDPPGRAYRVLVIEDEDLVAMLIADQLAELGHCVVGSAASVAEANRLVATVTTDIALVDLNLHGRFPGETVDILVRRKIPCLFVTGYVAVPQNQYSDIPVLLKPFLTDDLQRAMKHVFESMAPCSK